MARKQLARQLAAAPRGVLKAALRAALKKAPPDDHAFITRWISEPDDPAFERLVTDIIEQGDIGDDRHLTCAIVISLARDKLRTAKTNADFFSSMNQ